MIYNFLIFYLKILVKMFGGFKTYFDICGAIGQTTNTT